LQRLTIKREANPMNSHIHADIRQKLDGFFRSQRIPHLLFHGSAGTGKRTLVYDFVNQIYGGDKQKLKTNVMFVNCAHGKGIKFIRDELKFFAKTNIQGGRGISFKTIVLFNADSLTVDAQSALRRCIELFSYNTRFFIVVENKHKLLNPILSRFCEVYVPEHMGMDGRIQNLHQLHLLEKYGVRDDDKYKVWFDERLGVLPLSEVQNQDLVQIATDSYEEGFSALDLVAWLKTAVTDRWMPVEKTAVAVHFQKIKAEYRCEKLLLLHILDRLFIRSKTI